METMWETIYADMFRLKMKRRKLELYMSKVEECAKQNFASLHPDTIAHWGVLKRKYLPHICSCETWLCNYIVKIKAQCDENVNTFPYMDTQTWIQEYVDTCLDNSYFDFEYDFAR